MGCSNANGDSFRLTGMVKQRWADIHADAKKGMFHPNSVGALSTLVVSAEESQKLGEAAMYQSDDVAHARAYHNLHLDQYQSNRNNRLANQDYLRELSRSAGAAFESFNQFLVRTLAYGNGAGAIAGLAYLGSKQDVSSPTLVSLAILVFVLGFVFALLNAYMLTLWEDKKSVAYRDATFVYSTDEDIDRAFKYEVSNWLRLGTQAMGWLSSVAMLSAVAISFFAISG